MKSLFNRKTMAFEVKLAEVEDLRQTLQAYHQRGPHYVDFIDDLSKCDWTTVNEELEKAQEAVAESNAKGKRPHRWFWRALGASSSVVSPGLAAFPDYLCVLHGGMAVIFSLARHSAMIRQKILSAFEFIPSTIEMARNMDDNFSLYGSNMKGSQLHIEINKLQKTLIQTIPALINQLCPRTFRAIATSPFKSFTVDQLLDTVRGRAEAVRVCAEGMMCGVELDTNHRTKSIQVQLEEMRKQNLTILMMMDAADGKTNVVQFLLEKLHPNAPRWESTHLPRGPFSTAESDDYTRRGSATPAYAYTSSELLSALDVHHLSSGRDIARAVRHGHADLSDESISRVAGAIRHVRVDELLRAPPEHGSLAVAVDAYCDRAQLGQVSPTSYVVATIAKMLQKSSDIAALARGGNGNGMGNCDRGNGNGAGNGDQSIDAAGSHSIVLTFFCSLHTSQTDDLRGPRGMMRSLAAQLLLALTQIRPHDKLVALPLELDLPGPQTPTEKEKSPPQGQGKEQVQGPQQRRRRYSKPPGDEFAASDDTMSWGECEDNASTLAGEPMATPTPPKFQAISLRAACRIFRRLLRLVPAGVSVFCLVDGLSSFERSTNWEGAKAVGNGGVHDFGEEDQDSFLDGDEFDFDDNVIEDPSSPTSPRRPTSSRRRSSQMKKPASAREEYDLAMEALRRCVVPASGADALDADEDDAEYFQTESSNDGSEENGGAAGGASFRLLLTSPTSSRWLPGQLVPRDRRVSLRGREAMGPGGMTAAMRGF